MPAPLGCTGDSHSMVEVSSRVYRSYNLALQASRLLQGQCNAHHDGLDTPELLLSSKVLWGSPQRVSLTLIHICRPNNSRSCRPKLNTATIRGSDMILCATRP